MSMDFREGGGGGKSLHKICDQLDIRGVPYGELRISSMQPFLSCDKSHIRSVVVRELKIADCE
jgi:hypothetical protein